MNNHRNWILFGGVFSFLFTITPAFGQASFGFYNYIEGVLDAPVFDSNGVRLSGTNYVAMLYGGPTVDSLTAAYGGTQVMEPVPFIYRPDLGGGYFAGGPTVDINSVPGGGVAWLRVCAWDIRLGATYEDVVALGIGGYGESNLFQEQGGDPGGGVPTPPGFLLDLEPFNLRAVTPEPGITALLLLGFGLLLRRRHR